MRINRKQLVVWGAFYIFPVYIYHIHDKLSFHNVVYAL
jgi:hypothetical protein